MFQLQYGMADSDTWENPPRREVSGTHHPYPQRDLQRARDALIDGVKNKLKTPSLRRKLYLKTSIPSSSEKSLCKNPVINIQTESAPVPGVFTTTHIKCDFCDVRWDTFEMKAVHQHLEEAGHYSASLYGCQLNYENCIIKPMLCRNRTANWTKFLCAICPSCHIIFRDIFMCSLHHKYNHFNSVNGKYTVAKSCYDESVRVSGKPGLCLECMKDFGSARELHLHWRSNPDHHPLKQPVGDRIAFYYCTFCPKTFGCNFVLAKTHVLWEHCFGKSSVTVGVKYFKKPSQSEEKSLAIFGGPDGLAQEVALLKELKTFAKNMVGNKTMHAHIQALICNKMSC